MEIAEKLPQGHWVHSTTLSAADAAFKWHLKPSDLGICSPAEDIPFMIAYLEATSLMDSINEWVQDEKMNEARKKHGTK